MSAVDPSWPERHLHVVRPGTPPPLDLDNDEPPPVHTAEPSRETRLVSIGVWVWWHSVELAAVVVPLVLSIVVSAWFLVLSIAAAAAWLGHEKRPGARR